jgi:nucleoside phosphorylase
MDVTPPIDFVIITPLSEERDAVLRSLGTFAKTNPSEEDTRVYYTSKLTATFPDSSQTSYKIAVAPLIDMGRVEAATATNDAIRRWRPRFVLLVGIAGGYRDAGVQLGDVLISKQIADYEEQKLKEAKTKIRWQVFRANTRLLAQAQSIDSDAWLDLLDAKRPREGQPEVHFGVICTGDKVIANDLLSDYEETWDRLIGVEMEAGGTARAAFQAADAPGFFMIRGVSDLADGEKDTKQVKKWRSYACDVAATFTVAFLKNGPVPANPQ